MRRSPSRPASQVPLAALCALLLAPALPAAPPGPAVEAARTLPGPRPDGSTLLPNGRFLTPAGAQTEVGPYPFALARAAGGRLFVASTGTEDERLQLLDAKTGRVLSSVVIGRAWLGLAASSDGTRVYLSGANRNTILAYRVEEDGLVAEERIPVAVEPTTGKNAFLGGLALSPDGKTLLVARLLADDVLAVDVASRKVTARIAVGGHPYRPAFSADGRRAAVSVWGGANVRLLDLGAGTAGAPIPTLDHPSDLVFSADGRLLFVAQGNRNSVAVVDLEKGRVVRQVGVAMGPAGPGTPSADELPDGSTPNAVALSPDGRTLYVANADDDAVAVVDVSGQPSTFRARGFLPTGWYPDALALSPDGKTLYVANAKGSGSRANAKDGPDPTKKGGKAVPGLTKLLPGSVSRIPVPSSRELAKLTARAYANRKPVARAAVAPAPAAVPATAPAPSPSSVAPRPVPVRPGDPSPIKYVFYVIRENRTYDQVFGDVERGNGDPSLAIFGRQATPNAHALVDDFVLLDNLYCDAEVSADGHNWSMGAYATDFVEKTWVPSYAGSGMPYAFEGDDPAAYPTAGYLWDACKRAGVSYRNYGEFVGVSPETDAASPARGVEGKPEALRGSTCPFYPGWDTSILDVARVDLWNKEFQQFVQKGKVPRLSILRMGNDHTEGTKTGARTPRAMVADNDLALGRLVEIVSASPIWRESAIFVLEDDAQNGPDHVDCHRTVALVVSPFTRRGGAVDSTMYSTTSMLRTMELILGLPPLSQHDAGATPMDAAFAAEPDARPWRHLPAAFDLYETNGKGAPRQAECDRMDFGREDAAPEEALSVAIWESVRGAGSPMPAPLNAPFVRTRGGGASAGPE